MDPESGPNSLGSPAVWALRLLPVLVDASTQITGTHLFSLKPESAYLRMPIFFI